MRSWWNPLCLVCHALQAKKVKGVQAAFKVYNIAMRTPGKGELTMVELRVGAARTQACSLS
jgi:hypothetical protein